jgi:hypothetical protein
VETGSRQENASKQESRVPLRFYRSGKGSSSKSRSAYCVTRCAGRAACKGRADLRAQAIAVDLNPPQVGLGERRLKNSSNWDWRLIPDGIGRFADLQAPLDKSSLIVITATIVLAWALMLSEAIESNVFSVRIASIALSVIAMALVLSTPFVDVLVIGGGLR